ncbi:MAG TPA: hypothetical protein VJT31_00250 [Rugosimonospora sp.]|nr:hypothetical protein [Rugosimonospora sp.]
MATATLAGASTSHTWTTSSTQSVSWRATAMDAPGSSTNTQLLGINDQGLISGSYGSSSHGFTVSSPYTHTRDWHRMSFPGAVQTTVVAVSNNGTIIVGFFVTRTGATYGFTRWNGRWSTVAYPKSMSSRHGMNQLLSVNDNGVATGFYRDSSGRSHGYLYNIRTRVFFILVVPVRATTVVITAINNANVIVGFVVVGRVTVAFVIKNGVFHQLSFGRGTDTRAFGINSSGTVVGFFVNTSGVQQGFMWTSTGMHVINSPWGTRGTVLTGVNNRGAVVGFFIDSRGRTRGFVVVFIIVQATNYWWNWGGTGMTTPAPAGTGLPTGNLVNGGVSANSGHHW